MNCLILGKVWPEPNSTAAGRRVVDLIEALRFSGFSVHFASAAEKGAHCADLATIGVCESTVRVNDSDFDAWISALAPEVVFFDRFMTEEQFAWRVERACPGAVRILETSDLHCLREARAEQVKTGEALNLKNPTALREIASILRCDGTLIISEAELDVLASEFGIDPQLLYYWPFLMEAPNVTEFEHYGARAHFMMIGSFLHAPNLDAARWCRDAIWPLIRKTLPDAELHLYGSYGDKYAGELNAPAKGIYYKGRADDALVTMSRYRVNLAPLRFGAGLKGKVFDGFSTGTPTVMTPIAAEGIGSAEAFACAVTDEPVAFAAAATAIYQNEMTWKQVQSAGQAIVVQRFLRDRWQPRLGIWLEEIASGLSECRQRNFMGQMLRHHQHRSTEYMSRWIEAKNRK